MKLGAFLLIIGFGDILLEGITLFSYGCLSPGGLFRVVLDIFFIVWGFKRIRKARLAGGKL